MQVTALRYFISASFPQRQRPERSERLYLKNIRSILDMVSTTWRWGTSSTSSSRIHSPHCSSLFEWQDGQNPRTLHEKVNNLSVPHSGQRILANPHFGLPQSRRRGEEQSDVAISCPSRDSLGSPRSLRSLVMTCGHLLDNRTKIAILSLKPVLILQEKSIEVMKKHSIENTTFRMTLVINPCHGSRDDSRNGPE